MTSPDTTLSGGSTGTTSNASPTATCLHIEPGKNGYLPPEACGAILLYKPSLVPAAIFFILFGLATVFHFIQACIHRKLYAFVIVMGSGWEFIAMACRSMETRHQDSSRYYVWFTVFFLVAPICAYIPDSFFQESLYLKLKVDLSNTRDQRVPLYDPRQDGPVLRA